MADLEREGGSQGLTPRREAPDASPPPHRGVCHLRPVPLAVECRPELPEHAGHSHVSQTPPQTRWRAQRVRCPPPPGGLQQPGLPLSRAAQKGQLVPMTRTASVPCVPSVPSTDLGSE